MWHLIIGNYILSLLIIVFYNIALTHWVFLFIFLLWNQVSVKVQYEVYWEHIFVWGEQKSMYDKYSY